MAQTTREVATEPVRFRGTPSSLTGVLPGVTEPPSEIALSVRGIRDSKEALEFAVQSDFDPRILRLVLPADVAPGSYQAELLVDGTRRPAQLDVESAPSLRVFPEQLRLTGRAGETVAQSLTILNAGNLPVSLRKVQAFGVMLSGGIERALRRAYVAKLDQAQRRVDVLAESLAEAHGGLVRMTLINGAVQLAPGELQTMDVSFRIPSGLPAGTEYSGNWELAGLVYPVTIQVIGAEGESGDPHLRDDGDGDEHESAGIR